MYLLKHYLIYFLMIEILECELSWFEISTNEQSFLQSDKSVLLRFSVQICDFWGSLPKIITQINLIVL